MTGVLWQDFDQVIGIENGPVSLSYSGSLPQGLSLVQSGGSWKLSGRPYQTGEFFVNFTASNDQGSDTRQIRIEIVPNKWEEYAVVLRSAYLDLAGQRGAVQAAADDVRDFDYRRIQVEMAPFSSAPVWDVRIEPRVPSWAQRAYESARFVYETVTIVPGILSKAKTLQDKGIREFGKEWVTEEIVDEILPGMVETANYVGDLAERLYYWSAGASPSRTSGLTQEQAYAVANDMRRDFWELARFEAAIVESHNAEVAAFNASRQAFLSDLAATEELTAYEKMLVRDRLLAPIGPINLPPVPSEPEYLSLSGQPPLVPQGLDVIRVDPTGSQLLPPPSGPAMPGFYSMAYAPLGSDPVAAAQASGAVFHRWTQRGFDGSLLRVIHADGPDDPGSEEILVGGHTPANSGIYTRTAISEDGEVLATDSFRLIVGTLGGAPAEVDLLPTDLDLAMGTPLLLAPIVQSETVYGLDWFRDGALIASNVGSLSFLDGVGLADAGSYQVRVTNGGGSVLSAPLSLSVRTIATPVVTVSRSRLVSRRARPVRVAASVRNAGPNPDAIAVRGSRGNRRFRVVYTSGGNVTAQVTTGRFQTGPLGATSPAVAVRARVMPNRRALLRQGRVLRRTFNLDIRATALATGASDQRRVRIRTR